MYFIPHKNTWYSWLVHMWPLYRYGLLLLITGLLFFGGRGLYAWLDMLVKQEQASIAQLQQQLTQQSLSQCQCIALHDQLPVLHHAIAQCATQCIGTNCCDQCSYIFDEVHKAGLKIIGYHAEKASQKKRLETNAIYNINAQWLTRSDTNIFNST